MISNNEFNKNKLIHEHFRYILQVMSNNNKNRELDMLSNDFWYQLMIKLDKFYIDQI